MGYGDGFSRRSGEVMEEIFENIFLKKGWLAEGTLSGLGSTIRATEEVRKFFNKQDLSDIVLCDIPCGDMNWMKEVCNKFKGYYGIDIVKPIIANNTLKHANNKTKFIHGDICSFDFMSLNIDWIFIRDCLVHLSLNDITAALKNICNSNAKQVFITHFYGDRLFNNITTGQWRPINFCLPPFNFEKPILLINEDCKENNGAFNDKSMGVWTIEQIRKALQNMK